MTTQYFLQKDIQGFNGFGLPVSDQKYNVTLDANINTTVTVPSTSSIGSPLNQINKFMAIVSVYKETVQGRVWFANNTAATVPAGNSFALTASEMIVQDKYFAREVKAGDVLNFLSPVDDTEICVLFYSLPAT